MELRSLSARTCEAYLHWTIELARHTHTAPEQLDPALGGQAYHCPACGHEEVRFHSCGNRHCPMCQALTKEC